MREFSLKRLVEVCIQRLMIFILVGLIAGTVFGVAGFASGYKSYHNPILSDKLKKENQQMMESYEGSITSTESLIENKEATKESTREYLDNSIYLKLNSDRVARTSIVFLIDTGYQVMPGLAMQNPDKTLTFAEAYVRFAKSDEVYKGVAKLMNCSEQPRYIDEILTVYRVNDAGFVQISVASNDTRETQQVADFVMETLERQVTELLGEHSVVTVSNSSAFGVDPKIRETRIQMEQSLLTLDAEIAELQITLDDLHGSPPSPKELSLNGSIKKAVLWAVLGAIAFLAITFVCILLLVFYSGKISTVSDIKGHYTDEILGVLGLAQKRKTRRERLRQWSFTPSVVLENDAAAALCAANAGALLPSSVPTTVFLVSSGEAVGDDDISLLSKAFEKKGMILQNAGNILADSVAVEKLAGCEYVIVLERLNKVMFVTMDEEMARLKALEKKVLGIVVLA